MNSEIYASDLLEMKLEDISDLFLDRINETDKKCVKVDLDGCCKGDRFTLRVCLCKGGFDDE